MLAYRGEGKDNKGVFGIFLELDLYISGNKIIYCIKKDKRLQIINIFKML